MAKTNEDLGNSRFVVLSDDSTGDLTGVAEYNSLEEAIEHYKEFVKFPTVKCAVFARILPE